MYLHKKGVSVVNRVSELEGKHGVGIHLFELVSELLWCQSVLIQTVVPRDLFKGLNFTAYEPVTSIHYHLKDWFIVRYFKECCKDKKKTVPVTRERTNYKVRKRSAAQLQLGLPKLGSFPNLPGH